MESKDQGHFRAENQRRRERREQRKLQDIERMYSEGLKAPEIAAHMGWSLRTMRRWLQRHDPAHPSTWMRVQGDQA